MYPEWNVQKNGDEGAGESLEIWRLVDLFQYRFAATHINRLHIINYMGGERDSTELFEFHCPVLAL